MATDMLNRQILEAAIHPAQVWEDGLQQSFCFTSDFIGFQGHFPDNPLLPAVVQLQMGFLLAAQLEKAPLGSITVNRAKFMHPVGPEEKLTVYCKPAGNKRYAVSITANGTKVSTFILIWEDYAD